MNNFLAVDGDKQSGEDVRSQNVAAALAIANVIKSSFGPVGLDKMLVDDVGDLTITNDGATIVKLLEVEHPAGKVLVEVSQLQDSEVGDGTTSVVLLAAELLKRGNDLVKKKTHPTIVISGYRLAMQEACKYIRENISRKIDTLPDDTLYNIAKTSISSKVIGGAVADFFSHVIVDSIKRVKRVDNRGRPKYPVKAVNILKAFGKSATESLMIEGYALNCTVASQAMPKKITNAKIACLDFNLNKARMSLGVQVLVTDPNKLEGIRKRENDLIKERLDIIFKSGANVILTTGGIDDLSLKYFVERGAMGIRRVKKSDLRHIAKATGAQILLNLASTETDEEVFDPACLGTCDEVSQETFADDQCLIFRSKSLPWSSILLRGANTFHLDEMERSVHDGLCIVSRTLESSSVVPGGGAVETELSLHLEQYAKSIDARDQLAVLEFAQALLVIPKTLAVNAACDAMELVAQLRATHSENKENTKYYGLDLYNGNTRDNLAAGVIEPTIGKVKCIKFATEAAITILRIDEVVKLNPKQQPQQQQ